MRYEPIDPQLFKTNRENLKKLLLKNSLVVLNANDIMPSNADGTLGMKQNADLFYLTGVEQEETILLLAPDAFNENQREILFLRETNPEIAIWEGHKLTIEEGQKGSGIEHVKWLAEFPRIFHQLMCESDYVYLNTNEHKRAVIEVETRDARFIAECKRRYPLHQYQRLSPLMHQLRIVKSDTEVELIKKACSITEKGFRRVLRFVKPGVTESDIEAELSHEFTRGRGAFAYHPIIAAGANSCVLHYTQNNQPCKKGQVVLLDIASSYAGYNSDLTRTIPVSGQFTRRQKKVYNAVLRVLRQTMKLMTPGKLLRDLQKECEAMTEKECVDLGLLKLSDIKKQDPEKPAVKKYLPHGVSHPLGLDVHDVGNTNQPMMPAWVLTCEPGIYIPEEGFGIRLENNVLITEKGNVDLMATIPIEADEIEELMNR